MDDETRVALLELRANISDFRLATNERFGGVNDRLDQANRKLDLLIDELAAFRAEYNAHYHPPEQP